MPRARPSQLNVRSAFAASRARELARQTGMTATQIVEDALRAYTPPGGGDGPLVRRGRVFVIPAGARTVTLEEANAALDAARNSEDED
jgi:hypothetical protein